MLDNIKNGGYETKSRKGVLRVKKFDDVEESQRIHENFQENF